MDQAKTLESRLDSLVHEIKEIKKELITGRIARSELARERNARWMTLSREISDLWDGVPAAEEISSQREKTW